MCRLLFPFEFMVVFVAIQFALEIAQKFIARFVQWNTDVYLVQPNSLHRFFPSVLLGVIVGYIFVSLDYIFNSRADLRAKTTHSRLLKYGARSGLCAMVFWLLWNLGVVLPLLNHYQHHRYHAYVPDMTWLNIASLVQMVVLAGLLLWALGCSLNHRSTKKL